MTAKDIEREASVIALSDAIGPHTKRNTLHAMIVSLVSQACAEAVEAEREACADLADDIACEEGATMICGGDAFEVKRDVATAIRARSKAVK